MILCPFNSKIKINNRVTRSRRVNARMNPLQLSCPIGKTERRLRGSPIAGFFRMQDLPYLNIRIWDIKAKWRRNSGRTWDPGLPKKNHRDCGIGRKLRMGSWDPRIVLK